jgi:hypothetical protein
MKGDVSDRYAIFIYLLWDITQEDASNQDTKNVQQASKQSENNYRCKHNHQGGKKVNGFELQRMLRY